MKTIHSTKLVRARSEILFLSQGCPVLKHADALDGNKHGCKYVVKKEKCLQQFEEICRWRRIWFGMFQQTVKPATLESQRREPSEDR